MAVDVGEIGGAREVALRALKAVRQGVPLQDALKPSGRLARNDRALAAQLVYGVLRHQRFLDAWIDQQARGRLEPVVRDILRLAAFQLAFLDRVPPYAAVNAAVEQAKRESPRASRLVNAVLRRLGTPPFESVGLAVRYSHPDWLVARWEARYRERLPEVLSRDNEVPPLTVRVNTHRISREAALARLAAEGVRAEPSAYVPEAIRVQGAVWLEDLSLFRDGLISVQDESSMLVSWILDPQPGERIVDLAVGVGGKALHALEKTHGQVELVGIDIARARLQRFQENVARMGYGARVTAVEMPAQEYAQSHPEMFDKAILDAPCSGLGVLRRRVDARWKRRPEEFPRYQARQQELLWAAQALIRPGGTIVYSTCSTEPEETDEVLAWARRHLPNLTLEDVTPWLPHPALTSFVKEGSLYLAPGDLGMDGFFIARLAKTGGT
ncbi:MAG: 16S rRNA (cytosine(967)-C(5))-methyltransferase RsmB [Firmicutes bacterium]|nr:16S rRNA (cytosine(967)-C(5))-methyltransferase RsmB [Bacillota bacterium]